MTKKKTESISPVLAESLQHGAHVAQLSLQLFDGLASLHKLPKKWRNILDLGAQLHDIGWIFGKQGHHKASATMIREGDIAKARAIPKDIRPLVAMVARYHRRAAPSLQQERFALLNVNEQKAICILAAIIRLADALDFSHLQNVKALEVAIKKQEIELTLTPHKNCNIFIEIQRIEDKKAFFLHTFSLDVVCCLG